MTIDVLPPSPSIISSSFSTIDDTNSSPSPTDQKTQQVAFTSLENGIRFLLPRVQNNYVNKINHCTEELTGMQKTSRTLIELSKAATAHLQKHKDSKKDVVLPKEVLSLCKDLEKKGIKLLSKPELEGKEKVSLERVKELKSLVETEMNQIKSEIQIKFNQADGKIKELHALYECFKELAKILDRITKPFIQGQQG